MKQSSDILKQKIEGLPFSKELKKILVSQKLSSLQDLLNVPVKDWMKYVGFNYHFLKEITGYVQENGLGTLVRH